MTSAPPTSPAAVPEPVEQGNSLWHDAWLRLRKNKLATFGLVSLSVIAVACGVIAFNDWNKGRAKAIKSKSSCDMERFTRCDVIIYFYFAHL